MTETAKARLRNAGFTDGQILALSAVFVEKPVETVEKPDFWQFVKHFKRAEFACKCGGDCDGYPTEMDEDLVLFLDDLREDTGAACVISSGLRCSLHNLRVGGVKNSYHQYGRGVDFTLSGWNSTNIINHINNMKKSVDIIELYAIDGNYVHIAI